MFVWLNLVCFNNKRICQFLDFRKSFIVEGDYFSQLVC